MNQKGGFLLDTNFISELRKPRPNEAVVAFSRQLPPTRTFVSALTMGELRKGAALRAQRDPEAAEAITRWIDAVEEGYGDRILPIDTPITRLWGELNAQRTRPIVDTLLAATAIHHRLTLVTRNVRDMDDTPVVLHNPWPA